ncbi:hypothetical protein BKN14_00430 [Candidatus Gracilibacteria bacterium HOT-871]|nr:hypothetical protein BKN14_00430 [Candidatus Gracilibacteria bacterium HOT-871]
MFYLVYTFFMYKKFLYIPKKLSLTLNFESRKEIYSFKEPTMYDLLIFEDLILEEKYLQAIKFLKINIKEPDFYSNPMEILKAILKICYGNNKKTENAIKSAIEEPGFMPSVLDMLGHRYGKTPLEILKEVTPSIFESYLAGFEFNLNIENGKKEENRKFKEKAKITENEMKNYNEIMERVNKFDFPEF